MKAALFIPCYVDAFFPEVGIATLELLERLGVEVVYPLNQTCCGQPMGNSGCQDDAAATEALFVRNFTGYDYIVTPSGSCTHHVRENLTVIPQTAETVKVRQRTYERSGMGRGEPASRVRERAHFDARYGVFMTGPSATADIEGVLIHGAQGIRTLTVIPVASRRK